MTTIWVLGDQLSPDNAAFSGFSPQTARILMIEARNRGRRLRYHRRKLVLVFSAMRHFAAELRRAGWQVDYHRLEDTASFEEGWQRHVRTFRPRVVRLLEPSDFTTSAALPALARAEGITLDLVPTNLFLVPRREFQEWAGTSKHLLMENHYRRLRRTLGVLMEADGTPSGGTWNLDAENRKTVSEWRRAGSPRPTPVPKVPPDALTREVMTAVDREFADHPGRAEGFDLPVDRSGALRWLEQFITERLPQFGPYEDLMLSGEPVHFHSLLTPWLNLGVLHPMECIQAAEQAYREGRAELPSVEGFIRQILGWREFVNGVYWLRGPEYLSLNALNATRPLPAWFWTGETPLNCLAQCLRQVLDTGYNHHIQRLMVLGNFLLLTGIRPAEALRWFNELYIDAHDWVMAANVIGMALHADGGFMATKPYAAGGAYLSRMSDYCRDCRFRPDVKTGPEACPLTFLYWDFIARHGERFGRNPRMATIVQSWKKRPAGDQDAVRSQAAAFLDREVPTT